MGCGGVCALTLSYDGSRVISWIEEALVQVSYLGVSMNFGEGQKSCRGQHRSFKLVDVNAITLLYKGQFQ